MNKSSKSVWAVILDYNTGPLLKACVESFLQVNYKNFNVLVVDNASTDGVALKLRKCYPGIYVIRLNKNLGYCGGNNAGIEYALKRGAEYVLIVNPDTKVLNPGFVTELVSAMKRIPDAGIVGPLVHLHVLNNIQRTSCYLPHIKRKVYSWFVNRDKSGIQNKPTKDIEVEVLNGVCILLRKEMLYEVGLFDKNIFMYGDDWDMTIRDRKKGWKSYQIPVDSIVHLQKTEGYDFLSMTNFLLKRNAAYILFKHDHLLDAIAVASASLTLTFLRFIKARLIGFEAKKYWKFFVRLLKAYITVFSRKVSDPNFGPPAKEWKKF